LSLVRCTFAAGWRRASGTLPAASPRAVGRSRERVLSNKRMKLSKRAGRALYSRSPRRASQLMRRSLGGSTLAETAMRCHTRIASLGLFLVASAPQPATAQFVGQEGTYVLARVGTNPNPADTSGLGEVLALLSADRLQPCAAVTTASTLTLHTDGRYVFRDSVVTYCQDERGPQPLQGQASVSEGRYAICLGDMALRAAQTDLVDIGCSTGWQGRFFTDSIRLPTDCDGPALLYVRRERLASVPLRVPTDPPSARVSLC